jgi:hypothetical protein
VMPAITSDLGNPLPRLLPSHAHAFQGFFSPRRNALETERRFLQPAQRPLHVLSRRGKLRAHSVANFRAIPD